jgi:hypothetical protein
MGRSGAEDSELQIFLLGAACRSADILKPGPSGPGFVVAFAFLELGFCVYRCSGQPSYWWSLDDAPVEPKVGRYES